MADYTDDQLVLLGDLKRQYGHDYDSLAKLPADAGDGEFFLTNQMFGSVDAELLYAMIRNVKPGRIVEVGSGFTTVLIDRAVNDMLAEQRQTGKKPTCRFDSIDPMAPGIAYKSRIANLHAAGLQDEMDLITKLRPGDMLVCDTSHVFVEGHEIDLILKALPELKGVYVHFHDIFLPNGYPTQWEDRGYDEQTHLQAFLDGNPDWRILLAANWLHKNHPDALDGAIASYESSQPLGPGSFWIYADPPKRTSRRRVG